MAKKYTSPPAAYSISVQSLNYPGAQKLTHAIYNYLLPTICDTNVAKMLESIYYNLDFHIEPEIGYFYICSCPELRAHSCCKIGYTNNLQRRLAQYNAIKLPQDKVTIDFAIKHAKYKEIEREFKHTFKGWRIHNEIYNTNGLNYMQFIQKFS